MNRPSVIQGGMGVYISTPFLARASSLCDEVLGTVSCVAAERVLTRILQTGDPGGHFRRALARFPFPGIADRVIDAYFVEGGLAPGKKFKQAPAFDLRPRRDLIELAVIASFAFVWLAKEGHARPVSVNYLEKVQIPHVYSIAGAMLAGVDYVTMGAGITLQVPGVLDALSSGGSPSYRVLIEGSTEGTANISFDPREFFGGELPPMRRPGFLPIVSTDVLASLMAKRLPEGSIQGFVVELPTAGGHNAPPRGKAALNERGEPVYGPRDQVSFEKLIDLGVPFWVGGSFASPEGLAKARALGASGIQAGSIFALSEDSGMSPPYRREARRLGFRGELTVRTDPAASPTGFPFKVVQLDGTLSSPDVHRERKRVCDICCLRVPYAQQSGDIGYRCSAEPLSDFVRKGGELQSAVEARCLCNGLMSAADLGNPGEPPIITLGDDTGFLRDLMRHEDDSYTARDAAEYLLRQP